MCKYRQNFTTFKKVFQNKTLFGHVYVNLLKKSIGGGPGTVNCKHDPHNSEKHENSILNVGDLTLTIAE